MLVDYQGEMFDSIARIERRSGRAPCAVCWPKTATAFNMPIVLSTVGSRPASRADASVHYRALPGVPVLDGRR